VNARRVMAVSVGSASSLNRDKAIRCRRRTRRVVSSKIHYHGALQPCVVDIMYQQLELIVM
jgi:hypothetical protein